MHASAAVHVYSFWSGVSLLQSNFSQWFKFPVDLLGRHRGTGCFLLHWGKVLSALLLCWAPSRFTIYWRDEETRGKPCIPKGGQKTHYILMVHCVSCWGRLWLMKPSIRLSSPVLLFPFYIILLLLSLFLYGHELAPFTSLLQLFLSTASSSVALFFATPPQIQLSVVLSLSPPRSSSFLFI